jgi:hypothetical protein
MPSTEPASAKGLGLAYKSQRAYVALMFDVLGRLLSAGSVADPTIQREIASFPEGYSIEFSILGDSLTVRVVHRAGRFTLDPRRERRADLRIVFKHLAHAFALLSFQESTPRSFANGRMITDGDVALTMRFVRCLDRVQGVILPDLVAARALKSLPKIPLAERLRLAASIGGGVVQSYFRSVR